jgi:hypothetical protein
MHELVINLHMHTTYSDGRSTHAAIAQEAINAGLDAVIITDHNIWVDGLEGYYGEEGRRVLLMVGEEIHDQARQPQKNHLLVFGAQRELSHLAWNSSRLFDAIRQAQGLAFLAHPVDPAAPKFGEDDLSWVDWDVTGYTGIELWNAMSEFKSLLINKLQAIYYALNPRRIARGPFEQTIAIWDHLLEEGHRVVAIGGSDAHALPAYMGPLHRIVFPYEFHFRAINTHILVPEPLTGEAKLDIETILEALRQGRAFVGYDLPASTRGFRFTAQGFDNNVPMGGVIDIREGVTLQIRLPRRTECRLIRNGHVVQKWENRETCMHITGEPGAYRVEAFINYLGRRRGWIYSNPIYVRTRN